MSNRIKYQMEFTFNSSIKVLYDRLSTPSGLSEWFSDDVNVKGDVLTFIWNKSQQDAELINKKENKHVKFRWVDNDADEYFEFRLSTHELTGEVTLQVTDFAEEDEVEDSMELWNSQISELKRILGI